MERSEETDNSVITSAVIRGTGRGLLIGIRGPLGDPEKAPSTQCLLFVANQLCLIGLSPNLSFSASTYVL